MEGSNLESPGFNAEGSTHRAPSAQIRGKLRLVRRRVLVDRLLGAGLLDLGISLGFVALLLLLDRAFVPGLVTVPLLVAVLCVSALVTLARTWIGTRRDDFSVAVLTDSRLDLKERISSAVFLEEHGWGRRAVGETAGGEDHGEWTDAVTADAWEAFGKTSIQEAFPLRVPRRAAWILVPLALCGALALWLPTLDLLGVGARREAHAEMTRVIREEEKKLDEELARLEKEAEEKMAEEARKLLEALRRSVEERRQETNPSGEGAGNEPKKNALVEMTKREDFLEKGMQGKPFQPLQEALKDFKRLDMKKADATRRIQEPLKEGDIQKAKEHLDKLRESLSKLGQEKSSLTPEQAQKLEKLSEELSRLARRTPSASSLAAALSKASAALANLASLNSPGAESASLDPSELSKLLENLQQAGQELDSLSKLQEQLQMLKQAMDLVKLTKQDLAALKQCPQCGTPYCPDCGKPRCGCKPGLKPGGT